jgi:hypothetical protein
MYPYKNCMKPAIHANILETFAQLYPNQIICEEIIQCYDIECQLRQFLFEEFALSLRPGVDLRVGYYTYPYPLLIINCDQLIQSQERMAMRIDIDGRTGYLKSINKPNDYGCLIYSDDIGLINVVCNQDGHIIDHNLTVAE